MNERALSVALTFLLVVSALSTAGTGMAAANSGNTGDTTFHIMQDGECYEIAAMGDGDTSVEDFYDYRKPSNSDKYTYSSHGTQHLQENQVSNVFVYHGSEGYSIVLLHDKLDEDEEDGEYGSTITFNFSNMDDVTWEVRDDNYSFEDDDGNYHENDDNWNISGSEHSVDWMWADHRTDGGAFSGFGDAEITITPYFNESAPYWGETEETGNESEMVEWRVLDEDESTAATLNMDQQVSIAKGSCPDETSPDADLTANPSTVGNDESVTLDASGSTDDEGIVEYRWDFDGDGTVDQTTTDKDTVTHTYESPDDYTASVTVFDEAGNSDEATAEVTVTDQSGSNITYLNATAVEVEGTYEEVQLTLGFYTENGYGQSSYHTGSVSGTTVIHVDEEYGVNGTMINLVELYEDEFPGESDHQKEHPRLDYYAETIEPYPVSVSVESVTETGEGTYDVTFGYDNPNEEQLNISNSTFTSGNVSGEPPTEFESGEHTFTTTWTPDSDDERATWTLNRSQFDQSDVSASTQQASEYDGGDESPTVESFTVRSLDNETVQTSFRGSASITDIEVNVEDEDGNHVETFTEEDFTESDAGDYVNYSATTTVESHGTYVATLAKAADGDGNDAADGQTGKTYVGPLDGSIEYVNASTAEVTGEFERVWVYEMWYDEYAPVTDQYYLENVSGTTTIQSPDAGINGSAITSIAVEKHANDAETDRYKENPYSDRAKPYSASLSVEEVTETGDGTYEVTFGYENQNDARMFVEDSQFTTGNVSGEPPETLHPGENTTTVTWTPDSDDERVTWTVNQSNFDLGDESASTKTAGEYNGSGDSGTADPEAELTAMPSEGFGETEFTFDASDSSDDEGIVEYRWDFDGDDEVDRTTDGPETSRNYSEVGSHEVTVQVADEAGNTDAASTNVTVFKVGSGDDDPPTAELSVPSGSMSQLLYPFNAKDSTDDDDIVEYRWDVDGDGKIDWTTYDDGVTSIKPYEHFDEPGTYEATVTVVDTANQTDTATAEFEVEKVPPEATIEASSETVEVGEEVTFTATEFNEKPGTLDHICWKVGEEPGPDGQTWTTSFEESGEKKIKLVLRDRAGYENTVTKTITVEAADDGGNDGGNDGNNNKGGSNNPNKGGGQPPANGGDDGKDDKTVKAPLNGEHAEMGEIALLPAADADASLEVSETAPADVEAPSVADDGFEALSYVTVADADSATFTVSKDSLDAADATADDVTLFRYEDGAWTAVETEQVGETDDAYEFEADATDATYAVGVERPATDVTDLSVESQRVEPGETVTVVATVENDGLADGTHEVQLTVGGDVVATETVEVAAGATEQVSLAHAFDESGTFDVSVEGEKAEVVVEGIETQTTDDSGEVETSTTTNDGAGVPGFGVGVSLVALLGAALLALRRR